MRIKEKSIQLTLLGETIRKIGFFLATYIEVYTYLMKNKQDLNDRLQHDCYLVQIQLKFNALIDQREKNES